MLNWPLQCYSTQKYGKGFEVTWEAPKRYRLYGTLHFYNKSHEKHFDRDSFSVNICCSDLFFYFFIFRSFSSHLLLYSILFAYICLAIYIYIRYFYFLQEKRKNAVAVRTDDRMVSYDRKEGWKNTHTHTHTHNIQK